MVVVFNPREATSTQLISIESIRKTQERRALLSKYEVVIIDTNTKAGAVTYQRYGSPSLPRVVITDKNLQKILVSTSE